MYNNVPFSVLLVATKDTRIINGNVKLKKIEYKWKYECTNNRLIVQLLVK